MAHLQSSSDLFVIMVKSISLFEYRQGFEKYWTKRTEERTRPSGARMPGPEAQDRSEGTQKSSRRKAGRRQAEQGGGDGS